VGLQGHLVEKDLVKLLRKHITATDLPLKGIAKKRGQNYGFLQFSGPE
jgi:hypothetical protein